MAIQNMTAAQITEALAEVGETGTAHLLWSNLYIQREANGQWWLCGTVKDPDEAYRLIDKYLKERR